MVIELLQRYSNRVSISLKKMLNSNKLLIVYETRNAQVTFAENGCLIHTWLELLMVQL